MTAGRHRYNPVPINGQVLYRAGLGWMRVTEVRATCRQFQRVVEGVEISGSLRATWVVNI